MFLADSKIKQLRGPPHLMARPLQKVEKSLTVTASLDANQRPSFQVQIERLGLTVALAQLVFAFLPGPCIENRYLLPTGMKIASCNLHRWLLPIFELVVLNPLDNSIFAKAFFLITSIHAPAFRRMSEIA
jgi:hypothetical protein